MNPAITFEQMREETKAARALERKLPRSVTLTLTWGEAKALWEAADQQQHDMGRENGVHPATEAAYHRAMAKLAAARRG